jgi:hypothetical protein
MRPRMPFYDGGMEITFIFMRLLFEAVKQRALLILRGEKTHP